MSEKTQNSLLTTLMLAVAFAVFTFLVSRFDVAPIGLENTNIGFSSINGPIHEAIGFSNVWYVVSKLIGYLAFVTVAFFGLLGLLQAVKRKGIFKIDSDIIALAVFYVVVLAMYIVFDHVYINYRPIYLGEELEYSYPSSHTMLGLCCYITAAFQFKSRIKGSKGTLMSVLCYVLAAVAVISRALSGVHWFTDIIGSVILSSVIISFYLLLVSIGKDIERHKCQKNEKEVE